MDFCILGEPDCCRTFNAGAPEIVPAAACCSASPQPKD
jgi:hypothetical protein